MKLIKILIIILFINKSNSFADNFKNFDQWKKDFKIIALANNIEETTFEKVMSNVKNLSKVIEYNRDQTEFYKDNKTYMDKRTSQQKQKHVVHF